LVIAPAQAQDVAMPFAPIVLDQCLDAGLQDLCIGMVARACQAQDGARGPCLGLENAFWLARIDTLTQDLAGIDLRIQANTRRRALPASLTDLAAVNAAHATMVEQRCAYESSAWSGMHTGPIEYQCRVRENARHALWLRGLLIND